MQIIILLCFVISRLSIGRAQNLIFNVLVQKCLYLPLHAIYKYVVLCDDNEWCNCM